MPTTCQPALALPEYMVGQEALLEALRSRSQSVVGPGLEPELRLRRQTSVEQRLFVIPLEQLFDRQPLPVRMQMYLDSGLRLLCEVAHQTLEQAELAAWEIDHFIVTSCTASSLAMPSLDAYLLEALPFRQSVRRLPVSQRGCHGGATALAQAALYLRVHPDQDVLVRALERCSLLESSDHLHRGAFVSRGLFADAAATVVVRGDNLGRRMCIEAIGQHLVLHLLSYMWYQIEEEDQAKVGNQFFETKREGVAGLRKGLPAVHMFLAAQGYTIQDMDFLILHTRGSRAIDAVIEELGIEERHIAVSRESLRERGNLSSGSTSRMLTRTFRDPYLSEQDALSLLLAFESGSTIEMEVGRWK